MRIKAATLMEGGWCVYANKWEFEVWRKARMAMKRRLGALPLEEKMLEQGHGSSYWLR